MTSLSRKTKETDINIELDLYPPLAPLAKINTEVGFFNHMLTAFAIHMGISLTLSCNGDLGVDCHHTIEDTGILLGQAFAKELGNKAGITRYGSFYVPMDESLGFCSVDISGRPFLVFTAEFTADKIGDMDTQMVEEFFRAFCFNAGITLHINVPYGKNDHHKTEAIFKSVAHALSAAIMRTKSNEVLSTKGVL